MGPGHNVDEVLTSVSRKREFELVTDKGQGSVDPSRTSPHSHSLVLPARDDQALLSGKTAQEQPTAMCPIDVEIKSYTHTVLVECAEDSTCTFTEQACKTAGLVFELCCGQYNRSGHRTVMEKDVCAVGLLEPTMFSLEMMGQEEISGVPKPHWLIVMTARRHISTKIRRVRDHFCRTTKAVGDLEVDDNRGTKLSFNLRLHRTSETHHSEDDGGRNTVWDLLRQHFSKTRANMSPTFPLVVVDDVLAIQ